MSLIYSSRDWVYTPDKTDYKTDYETNLKTDYPESYGGWETESYQENVCTNQYVQKSRQVYDFSSKSYRTEYYYENVQTCNWVPKTRSVYKTYRDQTNIDLNRGNKATNEYNTKLKNENIALNKLNTGKNTFNTTVNNIANATRQGSYNYLQAKQAIQNQKETLTGGGLSSADADKILFDVVGPTGSYRNFYITERIEPWDPSVLSANLTTTVKQRADLGDSFNKYLDGSSGYYLTQTEQGRKASADWDAAVAADDLDKISQYGSKETYAKQDYLNQITDPTKTTEQIRAIRGSEVAPLSDVVTDYKEKVFPDAVAQQTRDDVQNKIFGLQPAKTPGLTGYEFRDVTTELSNFISSDKTTNNLWNQAKNESRLAEVSAAAPGVWQKLINSLKDINPNVDKTFLTDQENFGTLLRSVATLREDDATDKKIIDSNKQLVDVIKGLKSNATFKDIISYTPKINEAFNSSVQASEAEQTKKFGQLRQGVLQDTINQLVEAKRQEATLSLLKSSSVGQEISGLQETLNNSLMGDIGIGGTLPGLPSQEYFKKKLDLGLDNVFGTKNGLIYNWEDWFNTQIEKKYAGNIDIPNDYVAPKFRTAANGFVDQATIDTWKKYDQAYAALKINPNDQFAKAIVADRPSNYIAIENRKVIDPGWTEYETKLKEAGYVDPKTITSWTKYDNAYTALQKDPNDANAKVVYAQRPVDYIVPEKRMDKDVQFAKDFFSQYLKPRFDASQSISEFQDYIDVTKNTQNPFQTQDRLNALKLAAQTSVSNWFANLQKAGDSRFNADYYFDPVGYLKTNGVGDPTNPLLPGAAFGNYANTAAGKNFGVLAAKQKAQVDADWLAAKNSETTKDEYGNTINWAAEAYRYGIDVNDKAAFAKLHYQLYGLNVPEKDINGKIVKDSSGNIVYNKFDAAPDVYAPQVADTYIAQILTPYLIDKANKIGSVFGEFVKPGDYVDEVLKAVNLPENKDQWAKILDGYGINPNASLDEIRNTLTDALSQDSTQTIKKKIGDLITAGKTPKQTELGVEFIQRATTPSGTTTAASGVYALFKNAGFSGTEDEFYSTFMPDASEQDINIINASYAPAGKATLLLPTISGTGLEQIASIADLFGDTDVQAVLATAGVTPSETKKPSLFAQLITTSGEDVGIGDPFADTTTTVSGTTTSSSTDKLGISNPFDDVGIGDPFAESTDPFADSSNPFGTIRAKTSATTPKIGSVGNLFGSASSSTKGFSSSLFDDFGGF